MKNAISLCEIKQGDKDVFLLAMQESPSFHHPWVKASLSSEEFDEYFSIANKSKIKDT